MLTILGIAIALLSIFLLRLCYRLSIWHHLGHIPGPWYTAISSAWLQYHTLRGTQARATQKLHRRYGAIARVAPNEVEIADGAAIWPVYIHNGGFSKSFHYAALDIDGHSTVFSTLINRERAARLKVALPFFSSAAVQKQIPMIEELASHLVQQLELHSKGMTPLDLLDLCRCYGLDTTSQYVFGEAFGALHDGHLAIAPIVDSFLEQNLLFNIPSYLRRVSSFCFDALMTKADARQADVRVDEWIRRVVKKNIDESGDDLSTYPSKLSHSGLPLDEVVCEGKDAIFGATDALGLTISLILWRLVSDNSTYSALYQELQVNADVQGVKLQSLPVLTGIAKETMRIASTVPCKLPRVTPPEGMSFDNTFIPGGVVVGVASYMLHYNEAVYPQAHTFDFGRWKTPTDDMTRDWMPFGKGSRACMGRHLALMQIYVAVAAVVRSRVLDGARPLQAFIEFWEWYNVKVAGDGVQIHWQDR